MKLFRCHAVLPSVARDETHVVRTYLTIARTWQEARLRVREEEPGAAFISMPSEAPDATMTQIWTITPTEFAALRLACEWNNGERSDE